MCIIYFQVRTFVLQCPQLGGESPLPITSHVSAEPDTGTKPRPPSPGRLCRLGDLGTHEASTINTLIRATPLGKGH